MPGTPCLGAMDDANDSCLASAPCVSIPLLDGPPTLLVASSLVTWSADELPPPSPPNLGFDMTDAPEGDAGRRGGRPPRLGDGGSTADPSSGMYHPVAAKSLAGTEGRRGCSIVEAPAEERRT